MGLLNRLFRRDDRSDEIDALVKTHFNLNVKNLHYYKEALRHSSAIDGDVNGITPCLLFYDGSVLHCLAPIMQYVQDT